MRSDEDVTTAVMERSRHSIVARADPFRLVAHATVSARLLLLAQSSHATVVAPTGVEQSDRSPMTMAGADLLFFSHEYLFAVVRRRT
jgi:hypothetical protein